MDKPIKKVATQLHYYSLPLEAGTSRITLKTLNEHSEFRFTERSYLVIRKKAISFQNEILTLDIQIGEEENQQVYIRIMQTELRISCNLGTDETHLSRIAYFALYRFVSFHGYYDFQEYYWPDFFNTNTGKSKYLDIINDRAGLDVTVKPKYSTFFKPGQELIYPSKEAKIISRSRVTVQMDTINKENSFVIGYCLADIGLRFLNYTHLPFIIPYVGTWTIKKDGVKGFRRFIKTQEEAANYDYTPAQIEINKLSFKMMEYAMLRVPEEKSSEKVKLEIGTDTARKMKHLYVLWQQIFPLLQGQRFISVEFLPVWNECG